MLPGHDSEYSERVEQGAPKRLGDLQGRDRKVDFAVLDHVEESIAAALDKPYFPPSDAAAGTKVRNLRHRRLEESAVSHPLEGHRPYRRRAPLRALEAIRPRRSRRRLRASISRPSAARAMRRPIRSNN